MALEPTVNQLAPGTFEYQTYDNSDQTLIAQSDLDTAFTASTDYIEYFIYDQNKELIFPDYPEPLLDYDVREGDILLNPENKKIMDLDKAYKSIFLSKNLHENLTKINGEYKNNELVKEVIAFIEKD